MDIRPLTKQTREGALYQREPHVIRQIGEVTSLDDPALLTRAIITNQDASDYLAEEALIYFLREARLAGNEDLVGKLANHLLRRCSKTVRRQLASRGVFAANLDDAAADVIGTLFSQVADVQSDKGDFFQVHFFTGLQALSVKAVIRYRRQQELAASAVALDGEVAPDAEEDSIPPQVSEQDQLYPPPTAEDMTLVRLALATLELHVRQVFVLHHYYRVPIDSKDPSVRSLSAMFNRSGRTIQNWLTRAEEQLRPWRNEEEI